GLKRWRRWRWVHVAKIWALAMRMAGPAAATFACVAGKVAAVLKYVELHAGHRRTHNRLRWRRSRIAGALALLHGCHHETGDEGHIRLAVSVERTAELAGER